MGWLLFIGTSFLSILKHLVKVFVWVFARLFKLLVFIVGIFYKLGLGWLAIYALFGVLLYITGGLAPDTPFFLMFLWGLIPVALITMFSIFIRVNKLKKRRLAKLEQQLLPQSGMPQQQLPQNDEYVQTDMTTQQSPQTNTARLISRYRDVVNPNVIVYEYTDRFEKYLITPTEKQLVDIVEKC